jgi:short-subunit dehydrogenase
MSASSLSVRYRSAFITGVSTGLGLAFTEMLLKEGIEVWGTSRNPQRLATRANFHAVVLELGDGDETERKFLDAEREAGGFDLVINNAGFGAFGSFAHNDFSVWEEQLRVMLVNTARLSHLAVKAMLARRRGALVNISSLAAEFALPYQSGYNVVKAGLSMLNESLMYELKDSGVIVIDFRPGDYVTDFEGSVRRPTPQGEPSALTTKRMASVWTSFERLMRTGPRPEHAAESLRRALIKGRSGTVRTGRVFQTVIGPFMARFGSLALRRRILEKYFGL